MYFPDLSPYNYLDEESEAQALNIGWLSSAPDFNKGTPPVGFVDRLRTLLKIRVNQTRGFHVCPFCPELAGFLGIKEQWCDEDKVLYNTCHSDGRFSSAEIRVVGGNGHIYASPRMIVHYVEAHGYLPPKEFIEAVMSTVSIE